jgi:uncharacterized heparinase superfamily protein
MPSGPVPLALWPEAGRVALDHLGVALLDVLRQGWLYRQTLRGPITDRIAYQPDDPRPKRLEDADGYFRGRFRFEGQTVEAKQSSIFDQPAPSADYAAALHGFEWLRHLEVAGGDLARQLAIKLVNDWLRRHGRYQRPAWQPEIIARRFINLFAHSRFFLLNSDLMWRSKLFVSLRNQACVLARTVEDAPEGLPRLEAAAALALAGPCLSDARNTAAGLKFLNAEIARQILPDGGHVSRSPESLVHAFLILSMVQRTLDASNHEIEPALRSALDRMAPMLRFFRLSDGALSVFNGGSEGDAKTIAALLVQDETGGRPFGHAPHSGYQRLMAGRHVCLIDTGTPPPGPFSTAAHGGCLSFEFSVGPQRLVVNCGSARGVGFAYGNAWLAALRATAAHSTLTLADTSSAPLLGPGKVRDFLGRRLLPGPTHVEKRRNETAQGIAVDAGHNGYEARFGIRHERHLALSPKGLVLTGVDRLIPVRSGTRASPLGFAIRFHIHPDVRVSLAQGGTSVLLKLPSGEGWRFRCGGGALSLEESVYCGGGQVRRTEQLVIAGQTGDGPVECAWLFEQVGGA